ncbi:KilA-N domain-containing protein [Bacterioplanoides sp.]|uniref:KilA-N domain-containing protein n=1 Tax=Bacterioplanoides sp. TaxID=2066072 RepID=UPI003B5B8AAB
MKSLMLCGHSVRVDDQGLINLNDMHEASGSRRAKEPSKFMRMKDTVEYVSELNTHNLGHFRSQRGRRGGTWVCKYIAYKYGSWIDKKFEVGVMKVLDAYFSGDLNTDSQWQMQQELQEHILEIRISEQIGSFHGRGLHQRKKEKRGIRNSVLIEG